MRTRAIIEGLQTLMPFYTAQGGCHTGVERDIFYAYPTDTPLSAVALDKMIELGWHQDHSERDYRVDFSREDYRPDVKWACYL